MPNIKPNRILFLPLCLSLALLVLAACGGPMFLMRAETPNRIATPVYMLKRNIQTESFELIAYERVRQKGESATIYIEGDGIAYTKFGKPAIDPTPASPLALHLASRDKSPNVIYLARPCQYTDKPAKLCNSNIFWTGGRYSKPVIQAMDAALDNIKSYYNLKGFDIVGWGGGGTVAALLAARRSDIYTIRTVAGNLDHRETAAHLNTVPYDKSLNPVDIAPRIADIPQYHFIGKYDIAVPSRAMHKFRDASGKTSCIRYSVIDSVSHERGWVNRWPELLELPLDCYSDQ